VTEQEEHEAYPRDETEDEPMQDENIPPVQINPAPVRTAAVIKEAPSVTSIQDYEELK
jgi:hypothetical protein